MLLRRTQNGKVNEIHRRVRAKQVAPGSLARMGLAGDKQHAQIFANALRLDHGLVVDGGEFAGLRLKLDFYDIRPSVLEAKADGNGAAIRRLDGLDRSRCAPYLESCDAAILVVAAAALRLHLGELLGAHKPVTRRGDH